MSEVRHLQQWRKRQRLHDRPAGIYGDHEHTYAPVRTSQDQDMHHVQPEVLDQM